MTPTFNDKLLAYLVLFSGLAISGVAEYYSIMGLIAIYPAAIIPIVIMGVVLGIGKISATIWLKQNWEWSPFFLKAYVLPAIVVLMVITSLGVFGFLSKAHSDQSLVSGDVQSRIAIYDEKIKTAKDNIDANRKQLKQMDEAVDQVMGRSQDEKGADKAVSIRKAQSRDRSALAKDIEANQKLIATLNDQAAPIRAEVRKVEAEVGPIKYIAHLLYGENPDANLLEKAVIWVTILIVIVLDPLAVILLLASQYSFQRFREQKDMAVDVTNVEELPAEEEKQQETTIDVQALKEEIIADLETRFGSGGTIEDPTVIDENIPEKSLLEQHPYLTKPFAHFKNLEPMVHKAEGDSPIDPVVDVVSPEPTVTETLSESNPDLYDNKGIDWNNIPPGQEYITIDGERMHMSAARAIHGPKHIVANYVQNEEQRESGQWNKVITEQEYRTKAEQNIKNESINNTNNPT